MVVENAVHVDDSLISSICVMRWQCWGCTTNFDRTYKKIKSRGFVCSACNTPQSKEDKKRAGQAGGVVVSKEDKKRAGQAGGMVESREDKQRARQAGSKENKQRARRAGSKENKQHARQAGSEENKQRAGQAGAKENKQHARQAGSEENKQRAGQVGSKVNKQRAGQAGGVLASREDKQRAGQAGSKDNKQRAGQAGSKEDKQRAGQASPKEDKQRGGQAGAKEDKQRAGQAEAVRRALNYARETLASQSTQAIQHMYKRGDDIEPSGSVVDEEEEAMLQSVAGPSPDEFTGSKVGTSLALTVGEFLEQNGMDRFLVQPVPIRRIMSLWRPWCEL